MGGPFRSAFEALAIVHDTAGTSLLRHDHYQCIGREGAGVVLWQFILGSRERA